MCVGKFVFSSFCDVNAFVTHAHVHAGNVQSTIVFYICSLSIAGEMYYITDGYFVFGILSRHLAFHGIHPAAVWFHAFLGQT